MTNLLNLQMTRSWEVDSYSYSKKDQTTKYSWQDENSFGKDRKNYLEKHLSGIASI